MPKQNSLSANNEMELWIRLSEAIGWPIVALIAMGVVVCFFGKDIKRLPDTIQRAQSLIKDLGSMSEFLTQTTELKNEMIELAKLQRQIKDDAEAQMIEEVDQKSDELADSDDVSNNEILDKYLALADELPPHERYDAARAHWEKFQFEFLSIFDDLDLDRPDLRSNYGTAARRLSHGNRKYSIDREDADYIGEVHSQFKRFARLQSTSSAWLTKDIFADFMYSVESAMERLNKARPK